jgi:hypothetical protein
MLNSIEVLATLLLILNLLSTRSSKQAPLSHVLSLPWCADIFPYTLPFINKNVILQFFILFGYNILLIFALSALVLE